MRKFVKTKEEIYSKANWIMTELSYRKGVGFEVTVSPVRRTEMTYSVVFDSDYFNYYKATRETVLPCSRTSAKRSAEAEATYINNIKKYVADYCNEVYLKGGKQIEVDWDTVEE